MKSIRKNLIQLELQNNNKPTPINCKTTTIPPLLIAKLQQTQTLLITFENCCLYGWFLYYKYFLSTYLLKVINRITCTLTCQSCWVLRRPNRLFYNQREVEDYRNNISSHHFLDLQELKPSNFVSHISETNIIFCKYTSIQILNSSQMFI